MVNHMSLLKKVILLSILLSITGVFECGLINHDTKNVKVLQITANMPDGYILKVRNEFKSVPWLCFCGGFSTNNGSFIPSKEYKIVSIKKTGKTIQMPLTWIGRSLCKWNYFSTDIIITDTTGSGQLSVITIYNDRGDIPLCDTLTIISKHCVNPCYEPEIYYTDCLDSISDAMGRPNRICYSLAGEKTDTINVFVNMHFDDDSIYLCNEELRDCYDKWKAKSTIE